MAFFFSFFPPPFFVGGGWGSFMFWRGGACFGPFFAFLPLFWGRGVGEGHFFFGGGVPFFSEPFFLGAFFFSLCWFFFWGAFFLVGPCFQTPVFLGPSVCFGFSWEPVLGWKYRLREGPKTKGPKRSPRLC